MTLFALVAKRTIEFDKVTSGSYNRWGWENLLKIHSNPQRSDIRKMSWVAQILGKYNDAFSCRDLDESAFWIWCYSENSLLFALRLETGEHNSEKNPNSACKVKFNSTTNKQHEVLITTFKSCGEASSFPVSSLDARITLTPNARQERKQANFSLQKLQLCGQALFKTFFTVYRSELEYVLWRCSIRCNKWRGCSEKIQNTFDRLMKTICCISSTSPIYVNRPFKSWQSFFDLIQFSVFKEIWLLRHCKIKCFMVFDTTRSHF